MGLKQMLIAAAESQADAIKGQMMEQLNSDMKEQIATKINEKNDAATRVRKKSSL